MIGTAAAAAETGTRETIYVGLFGCVYVFELSFPITLNGAKPSMGVKCATGATINWMIALRFFVGR